MSTLKEKINRIVNDKATRTETLKSMLVGILCTFLDFLLTALIIHSFSDSDNFFAVFSAENASKSSQDRTFLVVMASGTGFIISFLVNYVLSVFFVFRYGNVGKNKRGFLKFLFFAAIGFLIASLCQYVGYNLMEINLWIIKILLIAVLFVFNYHTRRHYIFNILLIVDEEKQITL